MTTIFIIVIFLAIVIYDAALAYKEKQTVTAVFRHWYDTLIIIPFGIGVIFLGHFLNIIDRPVPGWLTAVSLSIAGGIALIISIGMRKNKIKLKYRVLCLIPIVIGYVIGDIFW